MKRALRLFLALVTLAVLVALAGFAWLLYTEPGLRWVLARASEASGGKLAFEGASGTLAAGVALERVAYADAGLQVEGTRVSGRAQALPLLRGRIGIEPLAIESLRVEVASAGRAAQPAPAVLPVGVRLAQVSIERLELRAGGVHERLERLRFTHIALGPRALRIGGSFVRPDARWPVDATFELDGSLRRFAASASGAVGGIAARATVEIEPQHDQPVRALEARAGPVDPSRLDAKLPRAKLTATLRARASADGYDGELSLANSGPAPLDAGGMPVTAARTRFASQGLERATLSNLRVELGAQGTLEGDGALEASRLRARLQARALDLRALRSDLRRTRLAGPLELDLTAARQSVRGALAEGDVALEADVAREGDLIEVRGLHARAAGGEARGTGRIRLGERIGVQASLRVERLDPSAFGDFPAGEIHGRFDADGLLGEAPRADARWTIERSTLAGRPLESRGRARFFRDRVTQLQADARYGPAQIEARGAFGRPGDALALALSVERIDEVVPDTRGRLRAEGTLRGTWSDPALVASANVRALRLPGDDQERAARASFDGTRGRHTAELRLESPGSRLQAGVSGGWDAARGWRGEITSLENAGTYPLRLLAPAPLSIAPQRGALGRFDAQIAEGRLRVEAVRWTPGRVATQGEVRGLPAAWLALAAGAAEHVRATMLLDGEWRIDAAAVPIGSIRLRRASGDLALRDGDETLALEIASAALEARFSEDGSTVAASARSRFGELSLDGRIGLAPDRPQPGYGPRSPLELRARIESAGLRALTQPFVTQARIDGSLSAQLQVGGTLAEPQAVGALRGEGIGFEMPAHGVYLKDGRLDARLEGDRLRVAALSIRAGDGEFAATGVLPLRNLEGAGASLTWVASRFGVLSRRDRRLTVSGRGDVAFDGKRLVLKGTLAADRGYLLLADDSLPRPGEDVVIVGEAPKPPPSTPQVPLALDVLLDMGPDLAIETQTLEGKLAGQVRLATGEDGRLRAFGRLRAVNAVFHAYGQRLQVDPGELIFDGPLDDPGLNIAAWRRNQAVEAGVQVTGNLKSPRVQLVSSPPVSEPEMLSWLVLGRAPGEASRADLGLLQAAASALLARGSGVPADRRLVRAFGIDEVSLRGGGELESSVVAVGKRVSDRLYVSYEQGLGAVSTSLVKLDYALGRRWSLRGEAGTASGAGVFYRFAWD